MGYIINRHSYFGIPDKQIDALELIAQATLDEMFNFSKQVYENSNIKLWNCRVYRSQIYPDVYNDALFSRLLIVNHACSYWAVIEFGQPSFTRLPQYKDAYDFHLFSAMSDNEHVSPDNIDWNKFDEEWGYGRASLYWKARKLKDHWYAPTHTIDFKHPLLHLLRDGCMDNIKS